AAGPGQARGGAVGPRVGERVAGVDAGRGVGALERERDGVGVPAVVIRRPITGRAGDGGVGGVVLEAVGGVGAVAGDVHAAAGHARAGAVRSGVGRAVAAREARAG